MTLEGRLESTVKLHVIVFDFRVYLILMRRERERDDLRPNSYGLLLCGIEVDFRRRESNDSLETIPA